MSNPQPVITNPSLAGHEALTRWQEEYEARRNATYEALTIRLTLRQGSPLVSYDPVQLDNLLAFAVVQEATQGELIGNPPAPCVGWQIPLPLLCLWLSDRGLPLWCSSVFWPVPGIGEEVVGAEWRTQDVLYWHKRMPRGIWAEGGKSGRLSLNGSTGRWMERRTPVPVTLCTHWEAHCWGDKAEVTRLLSKIAFVGKKRAVGLGEVARWDVVSGVRDVVSDSKSQPEDILFRDGILQRPIPAAYAQRARLELAEVPSRVGWTPPQWNPKLFEEGWQPGTRLVNSLDFEGFRNGSRRSP